MTASTVSFTASPTTLSRRTPILSGEKKSQNESIAKNGEAAATTNRDLNRGEAIIDRSHDQDLGHVTRRSDTNTTRRTRKVSTPKSEKARWKRVMRVFAKQLGALLIIIGFIQLARKMILKDASPPSFSGFESRIAEVDDLIKSTTNTIQVQVELLDKKIERESKTLKKEFETKSSTFDKELKKLESRTDSIQNSVDEVNAKPWVSKSELERVYEELKKGNVDDSAFSIDEMRAYVRDMMEKEIEKHVADGLGLVDYALGSGGAFVMLHSDPYHGSNWLGTKRVHTNAVKMLSPSFGEPGQCFALKGSEGYVQIRLRGPIVPEAFTLEHVAKSVAYDRSSAPKDCRVSGWLQGKEQEPSDETEKMQVLTEFSYDLERSNAQTFKVLDSSRFGLVDTVRLDFTSNHGSNSHTCIYRFRVHGGAQDPNSVVETQS